MPATQQSDATAMNKQYSSQKYWIFFGINQLFWLISMMFLFIFSSLYMENIGTGLQALEANKPASVKDGNKQKALSGQPAVTSKASGDRNDKRVIITGAPGDGNIALTKAIKKELKYNCIKLKTTDSRIYTVVTLGKPQNGRQQIRIEWKIYNQKNKRLGIVTQKNTIQQGELDGEWGTLAYAAANAAIEGIIKLLETMPGYSRPKSCNKFSGEAVIATRAAGDGNDKRLIVTGAPGDGNIALTRAIKKELKYNCIKLKTTGARIYTVVTLGKPQNGRQQIRIEWKIYNQKNKRLGTVIQKNTIPQGGLDGEWGTVADDVANAAIEGIIKLLETMPGYSKPTFCIKF